MKNTWGDLLLTDYKNMETKPLSIMQCVGVLIVFYILFFIAMVIYFLSGVIFSSIFRDVTAVAWLSFPIFALMLYLITRFMINKNLIPNVKFQREKVSIKYYFLVLFMVLGLYLISTATIYRVTPYLPDFNFNYSNTNVQVCNIKLISCINTILIFPIVEEVIFRRIMLRGLTKKYTIKHALIASSLIFAIYHISLQQSINVFATGLFFGFIYLKKSSLKLCITAHGFHNLICTVNERFTYIQLNNIEYLGVFILGVLIMATALKYFIATTEDSSKPLECNIE